MEIHLSDHFDYKKLFRFTFPSIVMLLFTSLYGIADGLFVANFAGKQALAAINFVYPILIILSTFGYMFGVGGSALVAKTMGEGKKEKANELFSLFVYISTALGVIFAILGFFSLKPLMALLGAEGEMLNKATTYGFVLLITMPFWNLQFMFQMFFVTAEKPKLGLYVTILAGVTNVVLDALFVAVFKWGIAGAAIATGISQLVGGGVPLIYFFRKNTSTLRLGRAKFDKKASLKAATNGSSEMVTGISGSLVNILYNTQLLKYAGEDGVAAYSIIMYVSMIFIGMFFGYSNGVAPVTSYHYGAENHSELKSLLKKSLSILVLSSVFMLAICIGFAKPFSYLFSGGDSSLFTLTYNGLLIYGVNFLFAGLAIFGSSFFTALNNGAVSATISFLRTFVFQAILVLLFPVFWGISGIWWSIVVAEALAAIVSIFFILVMRERYRY